MTFSDVITFSDVSLNHGIPWRPILPVYIKHMKILDFYLSRGTGKGVWNKICNLQKSLSGMQKIFIWIFLLSRTMNKAASNWNQTSLIGTANSKTHYYIKKHTIQKKQTKKKKKKKEKKKTAKIQTRLYIKTDYTYLAKFHFFSTKCTDNVNVLKFHAPNVLRKWHMQTV